MELLPIPYRGPHLDAQDRIAEDIDCRGCGYGLRGQLAEDECPICGTSIADTLGWGTPAGRRLERRISGVIAVAAWTVGALLVAQSALLMMVWVRG